MSAPTKVYDSNAVDVIICAIPIVDGRAEEFIRVTPEGPAYEDVIGADGHVARYATHERRYTVEVTLLNTSEEHAKLMALHILDTNSKNGAGVGVFLLKDNNGSTLLAGSKCWITKAPDMTKGKAVGEMTWTVRVVADTSTMFMGGA
jgi:hypothetical protein